MKDHLDELVICDEVTLLCDTGNQEERHLSLEDNEDIGEITIDEAIGTTQHAYNTRKDCRRH